MYLNFEIYENIISSGRPADRPAVAIIVWTPTSRFWIFIYLPIARIVWTPTSRFWIFIYLKLANMKLIPEHVKYFGPTKLIPEHNYAYSVMKMIPKHIPYLMRWCWSPRSHKISQCLPGLRDYIVLGLPLPSLPAHRASTKYSFI